MSDEGPWTDPQWAKPPKWQQQPPIYQDTIENQPGDVQEVSQGSTEVGSVPEKDEKGGHVTGEPIPATGTTGAVPALTETKTEHA